jgi:hypothetical protein
LPWLAFLTCDDDQKAVERARLFIGDRKIELWEGRRLVAKISTNTVVRFERGETLKERTVEDIRRASKPSASPSLRTGKAPA